MTEMLDRRYFERMLSSQLSSRSLRLRLESWEDEAWFCLRDLLAFQSSVPRDKLGGAVAFAEN